MGALDGKHAIVSGGGTGLGAAIAADLSAAGARVTILGRRMEALEQVAAGNPSITAFACNVTDRASVDATLVMAAKQSGQIDIAIANAGAAMSKPFAKMDPGDLDTMLSVNLYGVFHLWQAALPPMLERGSGRLVVIASIAGLKGAPYISAYCAAKHAVIGMTRALAQEVAAKGVTVNAVCPGYVDTPMLDRTLDNIVEKTGMTREQAAETLTADNPQKRFIQPDEVAHTVTWLCEDTARSVNGQAIAIAGGEV